MPKDIQRITLLKGTKSELKQINEVLLEGEVCLISSNNEGYDSIAIGDGRTEAKSLNIIPLNVSKGSVFLGIANPETNPGDPTQSVFYITNTPGIYINFNSISVNAGEVVFLNFSDGVWEKINVINIDTELNELSENLVQNKIITKKLKSLEQKVITKIRINGKEITPLDNTIDLTVDRDFSHESENPLMNCTISKKISDLDDWYEGN